jgi:hypothetical protein
VIFDNYRDSIYAKNAQQEVEDLRRKAVKLGAGISTVAFVGNEMARLSMRSRKSDNPVHLIILCSNLQA